MKNKEIYALGVMSGTSIDGIDFSLIRSDGRKSVDIIFNHYVKFNLKIKEKIRYIIDQFKHKIIKVYIVGKHKNFFIKNLNNKVRYEITKNLKVAVNRIFKSFEKEKNLTYLFSPASASYDQFKNFVERGDKFKNLVKYHAKKFN